MLRYKVLAIVHQRKRDLLDTDLWCNSKKKMNVIWFHRDQPRKPDWPLPLSNSQHKPGPTLQSNTPRRSMVGNRWAYPEDLGREMSRLQFNQVVVATTPFRGCVPLAIVTRFSTLDAIC
jgi:hypothetical protein